MVANKKTVALALEAHYRENKFGRASKRELEHGIEVKEALQFVHEYGKPYYDILVADRSWVNEKS